MSPILVQRILSYSIIFILTVMTLVALINFLRSYSIRKKSISTKLPDIDSDKKVKEEKSLFNSARRIPLKALRKVQDTAEVLEKKDLDESAIRETMLAMGIVPNDKRLPNLNEVVPDVAPEVNLNESQNLGFEHQQDVELEVNLNKNQENIQVEQETETKMSSESSFDEVMSEVIGDDY